MPTIVYGQVIILPGLKLLLLLLLTCMAWSTKYKDFHYYEIPSINKVEPRWQVTVIWLCNFTIADKFLRQTSFLCDINL